MRAASPAKNTRLTPKPRESGCPLPAPGLSGVQTRHIPAAAWPKRRLGTVAAAVGLGGGLLLATPGTAFASVPMVFELTGTFGDGVQVSYFGANDEPLVEVAVSLGSGYLGN
jgi:hypothetical protein